MKRDATAVSAVLSRMMLAIADVVALMCWEAREAAAQAL
jgi:hypothetical protein